jgi:Xaa-Pro dipeptidase
MNFKHRLEKVRTEMRRRNISLLFLTRGANLFYVSGYPRKDPHLTDQNVYGDYVVGAYIGVDDGFTLIAPRMGGFAWEKAAQSKPWIKSVRILDESEKPEKIFRNVVSEFDVGSKGIMMDDRAWAHTEFLMRDAFKQNHMSLSSEIFAPMRAVKEPEEIEAMQEISRITDRAYSKVVDFLKPGLSEVDVAHEVDYQLSLLGSEQCSFVTGVRFTGASKDREILASNGSSILAKGDSVTFDFGGMLQGYCSDFGRTCYVGEPPAEFRNIYDTVIKSQEAAIERMIDNEINCTDLDRVARKIITDAGYGQHFIHRLGHGIGVTVHEPPYLYEPDETVIRDGMVFTVEPSIMVPGGWSARIEDDVLVTKNGGKKLTMYSNELVII